HDSDHAGRGHEDLVLIAAQQLGGACADALRGVEAFLPGDGIRAAGIDDDGFHAAAALLQRRLRKHDRRGQKPVLREHGGCRRAVLGDDEAEVGTFLPNAGADAGREEALRESQPSASSASFAASRTPSGEVPPYAALREREWSSRRVDESSRSGSPCRLVDSTTCRLDDSTTPRLTISCASRNGTPVAASSSAASVASSSGLP